MTTIAVASEQYHSTRTTKKRRKMDEGESQQKTLTLVIKTPNQAQEDQSIDGVCLNWTVKELKTHLSAVYTTKPVSYETDS